MPILLYGFEVLNLNKSQLNSLDFVANRFLMKLFNTNNMQIIESCCEQFNFILPSRQLCILLYLLLLPFVVNKVYQNAGLENDSAQKSWRHGALHKMSSLQRTCEYRRAVRGQLPGGAKGKKGG